MIRYALKCDRGHAFESWFKSAEAFDALRTAGHLNCVECGSPDVQKAVMAPRVASTRDAPEANAAPENAKAAAFEAALKQMRKEVEKNATYVGGNFVREARAMHLGDAPERAIYGEAKPAEAKALIEDGVPLMPLPFMPKSKVN
ncbi:MULTISPECIES: DUF1178 family protein [Roseobacteraceae]|jgi:hypothetical protein|uniref:DUF1178 family protein n=1 Tax=Pseudosulfitobacter pseudonitzschiae TaxID=1402135 RepID=A0A221K1S5_9RHOB|nr:MULTISPECIES: DUF1178 family protein [Roseobacteraceae]ASM72946.1 hypothetical protein SULPSESMR1_02145 [Pseudosulfitobacter pseudonitzschiae]